MIFNGTSFNVDYIKTLKEKEFVNSPDHHYLWPELTKEEKKEKLTQLYHLIVPKNENSKQLIAVHKKTKPSGNSRKQYR